MPPLIAAALIGAGLVAGIAIARGAVRSVAEHLQRPTDEAAGARAEAPKTEIGPRDLGPLEYDPSSGVYRPTRRD